MTALDNIREDFFWFPSAVVWIGELVANLSPLIGLMGAIYLYYKKEEASRYAENRRERITLYRGFMAQVEKSTAVFQRDKTENWHLHEEIRKLWALQSEIALVGSDAAIEASAHVVTAINDLFLSEDGCVISRDGETRTTWGNVVFAGKDATQKLREDLDK
ncbi:hypothetical protein DSM14862_03040 [Sulfitobacter indolifex]|uniref:Uncharacterized protein n=1 Tax=Sulfitobacter indolifex HEL-45 TaxID=391624 RepID=A0ABM9X953_9RHOB|nr:hypothetical protein [Sulfitobacter indolifex]EDQ06050.1 hypothetical protein OIHEL45_04530 [Sulfitobacter indolifex HEL-45]UOA20211.1 hypothetical protein DSM14862_03040 [Sulfitobacter indolifex]